MKVRGVFTVGKDSLMPRDKHASEALAALKVGDRVLVKIHRARNVDFHRLSWAVFQKIGEARGVPAERVLLWLKLATGRYDLERLPNGKLAPVPQSTNFEEMTDADYREFWDDAWTVIAEQILPDMPKREFEELRQIVNGEREREMA